jgi:hypothetical protein
MYFEKQRGSNCRVHAVNNCFGAAVLSVDEFTQLAKGYADVPGDANFVHALGWDRQHLLGHILLEKFQLYCFTIGQFEFARLKKSKIIRTLLDAMDLALRCFFVCNTKHVWCVRMVDDEWYCLDSMRTPQKTTLGQWEQDELTLIFPWTKTRCLQGVYEMQKLVRWYFKRMTETDIRTLLIADLMKREPEHLGDCQTWIALFYKYLSVVRPEQSRMIEKFIAYETASKLDLVTTVLQLPDLIVYIRQFT